MGIDISEEAGWLRNKGLRIIGGGVAPPARLAGARHLPGLRTRPQARRLRRAARPAGAEGRRPPVRALQRRRARSSTTARAASPACTRSSARRRRRSPSTRRSSSPPTATPPGCHWRWACTGARTARWASLCVRTSPRRATTTTTWSPGWSCGTAAEPQDRLLPGYGWIFGMGDGTVQRRPRRPQHLRRLQGAGLARGPQGVVRLHARGLGLHPGEHDRSDPRRRPPDGLQPPAALHARACCSSATRAAWSTRSTARASRTPWSPASIAADVIVQAHARATPGQRELALQRYPKILKDTYGGYYTLGRAFVKLIGNPRS